MKVRKGLGRHPEGREVLGGKSEVEAGSQNEMLTGIRREAPWEEVRGDGKGTLSMEARELRVGQS